MKLLGLLPPREVEGADYMGNGVVGEVASGNQCRLWPAYTYDAAAKETRTAFFMEWRANPTPDDLTELMAFTDGLMGGPCTMVRETGHQDPTTEKGSIEWLRDGKTPKPRRSN